MRLVFFKTENKPFPSDALKALAIHIDLVLKTRGQKNGIIYTKQLRLALMNYLSGNRIKPPMIATWKDGIPKVLGPLIPYIRDSDYRVIASTFTVLSATRALKSEVNPDLSTITQPAIREVPDLGKFMIDF